MGSPSQQMDIGKAMSNEWERATTEVSSLMFLLVAFDQ